MDKREELIYSIYKKQLRAFEFLGTTIEKINHDVPDILTEKMERWQKVYLMGVKNSSGVNERAVKKLSQANFIFNTLDKMSDGGRAVDVNLRNPLSAGIMTGSSSAGAVNVLYGINDIALATDGGGSVLGPAFSLNLFSCLLKGLGYQAQSKKKSTDGIEFSAGTGLISYDYSIMKEAVKVLTGEYGSDTGKITVAVPCNLTSPDGKNHMELLSGVLDGVENLEVREFEYPDFMDRESSIKAMKVIFANADVVACAEGPVDTMGIGDSVYGSFSDTKASQARSGKNLLRIANMLNCSAVGIPCDVFSKGILLCASSGAACFSKLISLADHTAYKFMQSSLVQEYFHRSFLRRHNEYTFKDGD